MAIEVINGTTHLEVRTKSNSNFNFLDNKTNLETLQVGTSPNQMTVDGTKGKRYTGTSTVWKDMIMDLFGRRLESTSGKVDYDYDENAIEFQNNGSITTANDRVGGNQEINHDFMVGNGVTFKPHLHWWQPIASSVAQAVVFTARWRIQNNGLAKTTSWTTITANSGTVDDVFDFTSEPDGLYNQLTKFDDITVNCNISDTIQIQLTRTDATSGNVQAYFFDLHGQVDSDGSDAETSKT